MIFQCLGSVIVGLECLLHLRPDVLVDTTGAVFIYPIFKWSCRCKVLAYVHYPIISSVIYYINLFTYLIYLLGHAK